MNNVMEQTVEMDGAAMMMTTPSAVQFVMMEPNGALVVLMIVLTVSSTTFVIWPPINRSKIIKEGKATINLTVNGKYDCL